jgi:hypothetical protein
MALIQQQKNISNLFLMKKYFRNQKSSIEFLRNYFFDEELFVHIWNGKLLYGFIEILFVSRHFQSNCNSRKDDWLDFLPSQLQ